MDYRPYMVDRLNELNQDPLWFPWVCSEVTDGKMLGMIAKDLQVKGSVFRVWVATDPAREELYQKAIKMRYEIRQDTVQEEVYNTAVAKVEKIAGADKLRAAEMVLSPKSQVNISSEGGKITVVHESS